VTSPTPDPRATLLRLASARLKARSGFDGAAELSRSLDFLHQCSEAQEPCRSSLKGGRNSLKREAGGIPWRHLQRPTGEEPLPDVHLAVFPQCGEAVAVSPPKRERGRLIGEIDPLDSAHRATRRAKTKVRRYVDANKLKFRLTLTFPGDVDRFDHHQVMTNAAAFVLRLRGLWGRPFPYIYSAEPHPNRGGLHLNLLVPMLLPVATVRKLWAATIGTRHPHLQVHVAADGNRSYNNQAAFSAAYTMKFADSFYARDTDREATKQWSRIRVAPRAHFYEVAQGFLPMAIRVVTQGFSKAVWIATRILGSPPIRALSSLQGAWRGPPLLWMTWRSASRAREPAA
jgi:hypothetical protein